jgi:hypothetical protein
MRLLVSILWPNPNSLLVFVSGTALAAGVDEKRDGLGPVASAIPLN